MENRETYLENRVKELTERIEGMKEAELVTTTYLADLLEKGGHTSEETGVDIDLNEISRNVGKRDVIGRPVGGAVIRMFVKEATE